MSRKVSYKNRALSKEFVELGEKFIKKSARLSEEQLEEFREAFDLFDVNKDGKISRRELTCMMERLGQQSTSAEIDKIMKSADTDGNGSIEFNEFVEVMRKAPTDQAEQLRDAFQVFDKDNSGKISSDEIRQVMRNLGDVLSDDDIDQMIREIDLDGDGEIDYEEFVAILCQKS